NLGRQFLQARERPRCQRDQTALGPIRVRGAAASRGHAKTGFDVGQQLQGAEIASRGRNLAPAGGAECPGNLVHVQAPSHALHLLKPKVLTSGWSRLGGMGERGKRRPLLGTRRRFLYSFPQQVAPSWSIGAIEQ